MKTGRRTGGHTQPLSAAALAVIRSCPKHQGCDFVFTSDGRKARGDTTQLKAALDAQLADDGGPLMAAWVFHDLRRTLVSGLAKAGHDPITLDLLLGHKPSGLSAVAGVYQRYKFEDERRAALDHWARIVTEPKVIAIGSRKKRAA